jgi:hypothetical protein
MKLAIMQPYFFPYLGYFQLINSVDTLIIFDDVNFIKKGWINRNNILLNYKAHSINIPLIESSQNKLIKEIEIVKDKKWKTNILKTIEQSYKKAPFFEQTYTILEQTLYSNSESISDLNIYGIKEIIKYLNIETQIKINSTIDNNKLLKGQDKILNICIQEKATNYHNPSGGIELYDKVLFKQNGIELFFLKNQMTEYQQFKGDFISGLSIIDIMMFNPKDEISIMLNNYELI